MVMGRERAGKNARAQYEVGMSLTLKNFYPLVNLEFLRLR
jgi:hypothetical protein